ncbi:hypothetical protein EMIT0347P_80140 [Pseudomonas sp. IT-347P]
MQEIRYNGGLLRLSAFSGLLPGDSKYVKTV